MNKYKKLYNLLSEGKLSKDVREEPGDEMTRRS